MRLGYTFGGKQSLGTFGVPDLRGKAAPNLHYLVWRPGRFPSHERDTRRGQPPASSHIVRRSEDLSMRQRSRSCCQTYRSTSTMLRTRLSSSIA